MNSGTDLRPILGVLLIVSLVIIIINAILFSFASKSREDRKFESAALIIGLVGSLAWTIVLWPVMTGSASGAYVIRVNGVIAGGGLVNIMYGVVPFFVSAVALLVLPRALGAGIRRLRNRSAAQKQAGKPSVGVLILSIVSLIVGLVFVGTVVSFINSPGAQISPVGTTISAAIGAVFAILGIVGIVRHIIGHRKA